MDEEVRSKLKNFDDVLKLINDMIQNIDQLMNTMNNYNQGRPEDHIRDKEIRNRKVNSQ